MQLQEGSISLARSGPIVIIGQDYGGQPAYRVWPPATSFAIDQAALCKVCSLLGSSMLLCTVISGSLRILGILDYDQGFVAAWNATKRAARLLHMEPAPVSEPGEPVMVRPTSKFDLDLLRSIL